jgi:tetratricopeptide (TPR) repeat protein
MTFGSELRRLRLERGYSLSGLAGLVYFSKGHLSKIENDKHLPTVDGAWQLDSVLSAGGTLVMALSEQAGVVAERPLPPSGLTHHSPHFTGRSAELAILKIRLCEVPADPQAAVVCVIDGMPGIGKTALASRVARDLAPRFPSGVLFLDLHGHTGHVPPLSPADALDRLLRRLGLPVPAEPDERAACFRAHLAERKFLIVLDNARDAGQIRSLIPPTGSSRLLITSRTRLAALDIGTHLSLRPLPQDEGEQLIEAIVGGIPAPAALVEVVAACGGLPLALTIVAARLQTGTTLADLRNLLASGPHGLEGRAGVDSLDEFADGERSVIAALEPSYRALPEDARATFARLGQLPCEDWTIPYVAALENCSLPSAVRLTESLLRARLAERSTDGRLRLHDLVAAYARRTATTGGLSMDVVQEARRRVVTWAVDMAFRADALIEPHRYRPPFQSTSHEASFDGRREAIEWMQAEARNLASLCLQAHAWGLDKLCWQLAFALRGHYFLSKQWDDWAATHVAALAAARRAGDLAAEAMTRNNLGLALLELDRPEAANEHFQAVLVMGSRPGLEHARANALANFGWVLYSQGEWADSLRCHEEALRFYVDRGMRRNAAIAKRSIALSDIELERFEEAVAHLRDALDTFIDLGLELNEAMARNCLGVAYLRMGQPDHAKNCLLEAAECARQSHSRFEEARAMRLLGEVALTCGDRNMAISRWQAALDLYQEIGAPEAAQVGDRLALI